MEEIIYFFANLSAHLSTLVGYVTQAIDSLAVYIPSFFGPEIGALVVAAAGVALVLTVTGRG